MGHIVFITGATGGIGTAVARLFSAQGDTVVLGYHSRQKKALELESELLKNGGKAKAVKIDVTNAQSVENAFALAENETGRPVEVLINNAGIAQQKLFCAITEQEWDAMFAVHVKGTYFCCKHALAGMLPKKSGCIINISSMWGQVGASCESHYAAAKAAVIGLTQSLAKEEGPSGIRVNCIAPGVVDTDMMAGFSAADIRDICDEIPLGRIALPQEIAAVAVFLASESAGYITGQVIAPNGGFVV